MNFYNMLFGMNRQADLLLAVVGFKKVDVERFRDVSLDERHGELSVAIYTRTGGGNRDDYPNTALAKSALYIDGEDDDFDSTYRTFYLAIPDEFVEDVRSLPKIMEDGVRAEFMRHVAKTLNREPTEADECQAAYDREAAEIARLRGSKANGHTFVPYTSSAMDSALRLAEEQPGGELLSCWGILPLKITVEIDKIDTRRPKDESLYEDWTRFEAHPAYKWEIDKPFWEHCEKRFADKYPKAMAKVRESVQSYLDREQAA